MRRLIESGAVKGKNFVQVGLRGYWPPVETFQWMQEQGLRYHFMREIEERGADAVIAQAIDEALDGPDYVYLSLDIDVIDPGLAPGHRHARARRHAHPRGAARHPPDRRGGRPVRDGHRRGVAAIRPRRDDGDGRQPGRARGHQRPRRPPTRRSCPCAGRRPRSAPATPTRRPPGARPTRRGRGRGPRPAVRPRPARRSRRPGPVPGPGRPGRRPDPGAGRGTRPAGRPAGRGRARVTAVDLDPAMLAARAATGPRAAGLSATSGCGSSRRTCWTCACRTPAGTRFAFIALNSLMLLGSRAAQRAALATMAAHLAPGGLAVVDVWLPDADDLARFDGRVILEWPRTDPGDRPCRDQGRLGPARRGDRHGRPDHALRGGPAGWRDRPLGPPRPAAARRRRRARRVRRGGRAARRARRRRLRPRTARSGRGAGRPHRRQARGRTPTGGQRPDRWVGARDRGPWYRRARCQVPQATATRRAS